MGTINESKTSVPSETGDKTALTGETLFFNTKTIGLSKHCGRKPQTLLKAAKHNKREATKFDHIDPQRKHLNQIIAGPNTAVEVVALAQARRTGLSSLPVRKDFTQAHELLFSLPKTTAIDISQYFNSCLSWVIGEFGIDTILSADIHLDESAPHCHILVLPVANGVYLGSKLIDRARLPMLRRSFATMAAKFGLVEPPRRLRGAKKDQAIQKVLAHLESTQDPATQSALWAEIKAQIQREPAAFVRRIDNAQAISHGPAQAANRTCTGRVKHAVPECISKPIGFGVSEVARESTTIGRRNGREIGLQRAETIPVLLGSTECQLLSSPTFLPTGDAARCDTGRQQAREELLTPSHSSGPGTGATRAQSSDGYDVPHISAANNAHHFQCDTCKAAGRGSGYSLRCGTGLTLWKLYSDAVAECAVE